jgi:hypothetical protein
MKTILRSLWNDLRSADGLRDAAGLAVRHMGVADGVEQRGLAVIDVAHDGDDRRARLKVLGVLGELGFQRALFLEADLFDGSAEDLRQVADHLHVERLVDGREDVALEQHLDDQVRLDAELVGQLLDGGALADGDLGVLGLGRAGLSARSRLLLQKSCLALGFGVAFDFGAGRRPGATAIGPRRAGSALGAARYDSSCARTAAGVSGRHAGHGAFRPRTLVNRLARRNRRPWTRTGR